MCKGTGLRSLPDHAFRFGMSVAKSPTTNYLGGKLSMSFMKATTKLVTAGLAALVLTTITAAALAAPLTGAIFTTDINSNFVNANVYDDKEAVYLNGGPRPNAPCTAAGLPNGSYYFQVTDPSGKELLSSDDVGNRMVEVYNGVITAYVEIPGTLPHSTGLGKCPGSVSVGLFPYNQTPNPGGEYKVWITRVEDYDTTATLGSFGFIPNKSKTDNFKVISSLDSDGDGIPDDEDTTCDQLEC
jgi:hypothetical protein